MSTLSPTHVLVLYNEPTLELDHPEAESEHEVVETARCVAYELTGAGHRVTQLGISTNPLPLLQALHTERPDIVFNLFEGTGRHGQSEAYAAGLLEWLCIPFTGSPSSALVLARDKPTAKMLLRGANLATPPFFVCDAAQVHVNTLGWPVMVKPANEDASIGLDQGSVVTNQRQLTDRVSLLAERYGFPVLVEQFVPGREFNVSLIEHPNPRVLPLTEIIYQERGPGFWPIVTYESKWRPGSAEDLASLPRLPADVDPDLAALIGDRALRAFHLLGCRDYARIDIRLGACGKPLILEVNPNPDNNPAAGLAQALLAAGIAHAEFTCELVQRALGRRLGKTGASPV